MKLFSLVVVACLVTVSAIAGTPSRTVDTRAILTAPMPSKDVRLQAFESYRFALNVETARQAFADGPTSLQLKNFPVGTMGAQTLDLVRTRAVVDANSKILVGRKGGMKPITIEPVISYKGTINGDPETMVSLHYTKGDLTGFIQMADGQKLNVGPEYSTLSTPQAVPHMVVPESMLLSKGNQFTCGSEFLPSDPATDGRHMLESALKNGEQTQAEYLRELKLALEVNQDLWEKMHKQGKTDEQIMAYFIKVVSCLSQAYEQEVDATFYVTYIQMYTNEFETPYSNNGLDPGALLAEFSLNWSNNYNDVDRHLAHLFTMQIQQGGLFIGGIAYGGQSGSRLCNKGDQGGYGVSTMFGDQSPMPGDPTRANAFTWDIFVIAHEMGHNVGAPHTHNCYWNPPVDTCQIQSDNTDACYTTGKRSRPGTIMSYCHLVNGSTTPLTFGTKVAAKMKQWVAGSCAQAPVKATVRITAPRGSQSFTVNSDVEVEWASARVSALTMQYSTDNGGAWTTVKTGINAADRSYMWKVPAMNTTQLLLRLVSDEDATVADTTLATYSVSLPLSLTAPTGGERIAGGSKYTVRWTKTAAVGNCDLFYSTNGGSSWESITTGVTGASFEWDVPSVVTDNAVVRVRQSTGSIESVGGTFSIGQPRFSMLIPATGGTVCNNFVNQFRWSGDFIDRIRIQFTTNNGTNWLNATQAVSVDMYPGETFALSTSLKAVAAGTKIQMRILNAANTNTPLATLDNITVEACSQAVSVQESEVAENDLRIVSVTPNPAGAEAMLTLSTARALNVSVMLVDAAGGSISLVDRTDVSGSGEHLIRLALNNVAAGSYQLVVRAGSVSTTATLNVVR
ncbi:MAG: hypothetical protein JSS89_09530 [Bacteroidetes bacterium]|nr:hypothetical protein [Bacteroidota bacterium]